MTDIEAFCRVFRDKHGVSFLSFLLTSEIFSLIKLISLVMYLLISVDLLNICASVIMFKRSIFIINMNKIHV